MRDGMVNVAAGPLSPHEDPVQVLETHSNQNHNALALLDMRRRPAAYLREYTTGPNREAVAVTDTRSDTTP
jgi:hypothetical protein